MNQQLQQALDSVSFDTKAHAAVNYARARFAIEAVFDGTSAETNRKQRRAAKMAVVDHFHGTLVHEEPKASAFARRKARIHVVFPDQSKAIF